MSKTFLSHTLIKRNFDIFLDFFIFIHFHYLDLYLEFDDSGQLSTKIDDKRDDFNFKIINFPNMCSNIPASPAYGVYISQLIRYARAALASWIFLSFTSFWRNSDSYEYENKSDRRGAKFVPIGMPTTCWNSVHPKEKNILSHNVVHLGLFGIRNDNISGIHY
jgi:hypothetical protein